MNTKQDVRRSKWISIVNEFNNSGLTQAEFSRKKDLDAKQLSSWVRKLKHNELPNQEITQEWVASIDGLAAMVQLCFSLDPFSSCLFVFCNKNRDKLKILRWEHNGFWLYYRRLEKGKFQWSNTNQGSTLSINSRQLNWLLDGLSIEQKNAHKIVSAKAVI